MSHKGQTAPPGLGQVYIERAHPDAACSPLPGSSTCKGVQIENDVDGYS